MAAPVIRNETLAPIIPHRELIRGRRDGYPMPSGPEGYVVEDLDLIIRHHSRNGYDAEGTLALYEHKHQTAPLGASKERTFGLLHRLILSTDADYIAQRYRGFYVVRQWPDPDATRCQPERSQWEVRHLTDRATFCAGDTEELLNHLCHWRPDWLKRRR